MNINTIARYADDRRVQLHLRLAELQLRQRNVSRLSQDQQHARTRQFDALRRYWQQGIFPHNVDHKQRAPIFIDPDGRVCAVAHLVIQSGHADVAQRIHLATNDTYVRDMPFAELDQWAQANGLTRAELARIQPTYEPTVSDPAAYAALMSTVQNFTSIAGLGIAVGLFLFIMNVRSLLKRRHTLRWATLLIAAGTAISLSSYFIVSNVLNRAYLLLDYSNTPYRASSYDLQYSMTIWGIGVIFLAGLVLAVLGLATLVIQYVARRMQQRNKAAAMN